MCTYKINRLFTSAPHDKDKTVSDMMHTESIFTHMRELQCTVPTKISSLTCTILSQ